MPLLSREMDGNEWSHDMGHESGTQWPFRMEIIVMMMPGVDKFKFASIEVVDAALHSDCRASQTPAQQHNGPECYPCI
jgi:hypothetical protein